jgi:hypothetical protein
MKKLIQSIQNLLKLHVGLGAMIFKELNEKKSPAAKVKRIGLILKNYGLYLLKGYKLILANTDPDFRQSKAEYYKKLKIYQRFNEVISALTWIEQELKRNGLDRTQIRQFFRDFEKYEDRRKEIVDNLLKNYKINL